MFVQAEIQGRVYENVIALPPSAIRNRNTVLVIDEDGRLYSREVEVLRSDRDSVLISGGLATFPENDRLLVWSSQKHHLSVPGGWTAAT